MSVRRSAAHLARGEMRHFSADFLFLSLKTKDYGTHADRPILFSPVPVLLQASNGQWYQMNDSLVHSSNIKVVLNQQAYVLFYLR